MKSAKQEAAPAPIVAPTFLELTSRWARAKVAEELAEREAKSLKAQIIAALVLAKIEVIGFEDENLVIASSSSLDLEDKRLLRILRDQEVLGEVQGTEISIDKLRAIAKLNEKIARVLDTVAKETRKPRFEQAAKKALPGGAA